MFVMVYSLTMLLYPYSRFDFDSTQNYYSPITFEYSENSDVKVIISDASGQSMVLTYGTDYTLEDSQIHLLDASSLNDKYSLTISKLFAIRILGKFEAPEFSYGVYLDVKKVQNAFETISLHLQELKMLSRNTFKIPYEEWTEDEDVYDLIVPTKADRANRILAFDANGELAPILSTDIEQKLSEALAAEERTLVYRDEASTYALTATTKASEASTSADNAKTSEINAKASETAVTEMKDSFTSTYNTAITNIGNAQSTAETAIATAKTEAVSAVNTAENNALSAILYDKSEALSAISTAESEALTEVSTTKDSAVETIITNRDSATGSIDVHKDLAVTAVADEKEASLSAISEKETSVLNNITTHESNVETLASQTATNADSASKSASSASASASIATTKASEASSSASSAEQALSDCNDIKTAISQQLDAATAISVIDGAINITYTV